jgi:DNA-binding Lrp family transcriptional regulator
VWNVSHLTQEEGYVPVRGEFIAMLKERVWRRTREAPARLPGQLLPREYAVLKELSEDGRADFSGIDRKHGFGRGAALYTYNRLLERGMIRRITSLMLRPPIRYVAIFHLDQVNMQDFIADRKRYMAHVISDSGRALDRYTWICGFGAPYGILLFAPVYEDTDMERIGKELDMGGVSVRSLIVTSSLVGSLGFRRFDMRSTSMYEYLKGENSE